MTEKERLIEGLNVDLANEYSAVIMYRTYASMVQGPYRQELRNFFAGEIPEELLHAEMLADKVAALGGSPVLGPAEVKPASNAKEMLQNALAAEKDTLERYVVRRRQAEEAGEFGLAVDIDSLISDETKHRDEIEQILARWE